MEPGDPITDTEIIAIANQIKPENGLTPYVQAPAYEVKYNGVTLAVNRGNTRFRSKAAALSSLRAHWVLRSEITDKLVDLRGHASKLGYYGATYDDNINRVIDFMLKQGIITIELV